MIDSLADNLRIERDSIDADKVFGDYFSLGGGSMMAAQMAGALEDDVGSKLPANIAYQNPTIDARAQALADPSVPK
jgi:acyl carrier protein